MLLSPHRKYEEPGYAMAACLARLGSTVVLVGRSDARCRDRAERLQREGGAPIVGIGCDVTDEDAVDNLTTRVLDSLDRIDVLVTSAGVQARGTLKELNLATLRACLDVNVLGTWLAARAAAPVMRESGYGRIVTLASTLGLVGSAGRAGIVARRLRL